MQFALILLCVLGSLDFAVAFPQPASPAPPQSARRHLRPGSAKRLASNYPNPLIASRQVKANSLRGPQKAKRACPSFLPNGNCACPGTESYCFASASCVNLQTNMENCGTCGVHCPSGTACYEGSCSQCDPDGLSPDYCSGRCTNTQMDSVNCGTCGTRCPTGTTCSTGECVCETNHGYAVCNNVCVDTNTYLSDENNCGACGFECGVGTLSCTNGNCVCDTANGYVLCNDECVSTFFFTYSGFNCGSCGHECMYPTSGCLNSQCICAQGPTYEVCEGNCVDPTSDISNCGACGTACPTASSCTNSACVCDSPPGKTYEICEGNCVDTTSNFSNCGSCGQACPSTASCIDSGCVCGEGYTLCQDSCVANSDFVTDVRNCGQCGNDCISGETCIDSVCTPPYVIGFAYTNAPTVPICYLQYEGAEDSYYCGDIDLAILFQPAVGGPENIPLAAVEQQSGLFNGQYYLSLQIQSEGDTNLTPSSETYAEPYYISGFSNPGTTSTPYDGDYYQETGVWSVTMQSNGELSLTASWVDTPSQSYELSFFIIPNEVGHYVRVTANPSWIESEFPGIEQVVGLVLPQY